MKKRVLTVGIVEAQTIRKIRCMVAKLNQYKERQFPHWMICQGWRDACNEILEQLDAMAGKGKP